MKATEALDPGRLRHLVTIQQSTQTHDAAGGLVDSWGTYYQVRAAISTTGGREFYRARQTNSELTHEVTIYRLDGIEPKMRVLWGTRVFEIIAVLPDETRLINSTVLHCREING